MKTDMKKAIVTAVCNPLTALVFAYAALAAVFLLLGWEE